MSRIITFAAIVVILLVAVLIGQFWRPQGQEQSFHTQLSTSQDQLAQSTIKNLAHSLGLIATVDSLDTNGIEWQENSTDVVRLIGYSLYIGNEEIMPNYPLVYKSRPLEQIDEEFIKQLAQVVETSFQQQGYVTNQFNSKDTKTELYAFVHGYENGDLKCSTRYSISSNPYLTVYCGIVDTAATQLQDELVTALNTAHDPNFLLVPLVRSGDYVSANVGSRTEPGGYAVWAVKKNGAWQKIYEGQDSPSCSEVQRLKVPKAIYGQCYE